MKSNVSGIHQTRKSHKAGPGASRPFSKRSGKGMGGAPRYAEKVGAGDADTSRRNTGSALAHPVPGAKAPPEKLNAPAARAIDFEAPITITVSGRLAAALRFVAYHNERTPQQEAETSLLSSLSGDLVNGIGHNDASALEWLAGRTQ